MTGAPSPSSPADRPSEAGSPGLTDRHATAAESTAAANTAAETAPRGGAAGGSRASGGSRAAGGTASPPRRDAAGWRNWAGNVSDPAPVLAPRSVPDLAAAVRRAAADGKRVRVAGSGHSFSPIASSDGVRLSLAELPRVFSVDGTSVTVSAGMPLRELNASLARHGLALPNLGDIDAQTVAGALQTGTHGTGAGFGCLSTFVSGLTMVTADGSVVASGPDSAMPVAAAAVGLGGLGAVTTVTLECVPAFVLRADERPAALASVLSDADDLVASNDHFEFYWFPYTEKVQVKINNRADRSDTPLARWRGWLDDSFLSNTVFGAGCRIARRWPGFAPPLMKFGARVLSPRTYTAASHEVFCTPRRVRFVEMEYGLPRAALDEAFAALRAIVEDLPFRVTFPVEVRFTAADDLWLSHGYGRENVYIAVHQFVGMPYEPYFRAFERACLRLGGRPHWGKMHFVAPEDLRARYPRWDDWAAVRAGVDPDGVFGSPYLDRYFPAADPDGYE
jgi:L-gulonolactone oxidase